MNRVKFISDSDGQVTVATEPQMIYVPQQQRQMARPYLEIERVIDMADSEFLREFQKKVENAIMNANPEMTKAISSVFIFVFLHNDSPICN